MPPEAPLPASENPYRPPAGGLGNLEPGAAGAELPRPPQGLAFGGQLTRGDIDLAMRDWRLILPPAILLALVLAPLTLLLGLLARDLVGWGGPVRESGVLALLIVLLVPLVVALAAKLRLQMFPAHRFLRTHPQALDSLHGTLTADAVELVTERGRAWLPLKSLTALTVRGGAMVVQFDPQGLTTLILPYRFFSDPLTAERILAYYAEHNPPLAAGVIDPRKLKPAERSQMGPPPEDSIPFTGMLTVADMRGTPLESRRRAVLLRCGLFAAICVLAPLLVGMFASVFLGLVSSVFFLMVGIRILRVYQTGLRPLVDSTRPLLMMSGWIDDRGVTILNGLKQGCSNWHAFNECGSSEQTLWLRMPGKLFLHVVLPRHCFASDDDFQAARRRVHQHVGGPNAADNYS
ncbi:hypothetical protein [Roseimaritima sediminicola]|uniref:hypothetical protein n=1 Tax=Roseimaritima sediminicola TaxID=2662066 RepID=UPI00129823EA|nr:hypothetical protein [Roseimaritima sediminicola]